MVEKASPEKSSSFARSDLKAQDDSDPTLPAVPVDSPVVLSKAEDDHGTSTDAEESEEAKETGKEADENTASDPQPADGAEEDGDALDSFNKVMEDINDFLVLLTGEAEEDASLDCCEPLYIGSQIWCKKRSPTTFPIPFRGS